MPHIVKRAVLLAALSGTLAATGVQAAASPGHRASQATTADGRSSPWGYEQQRHKAMRQVNHVLPLEQEPQGKAIGK
ncbi:hypothetical protein [Erwinia sp. Leaf53]|uniref:hypothetical protein n=1 Tax=Erwinia sp. Leaf53 TaxID=1736225 RepID=UPI0006FE5532|nr:hypothetical protein [Erwinia sp. Leaf53]KQN53755.1 hypothetical protein ASF13_13635 [Erwinia sp. Leaf53]